MAMRTMTRAFLTTACQGVNLAKMSRAAHRHSRPSRIELVGRVSAANPRNTPLKTIHGQQGRSLVGSSFPAVNPTGRLLCWSRESEKMNAVKQKVYRDS